MKTHGQLNISTIPKTADWAIDMNPDMTSDGNLLDVSVSHKKEKEKKKNVIKQKQIQKTNTL